MNPTASQWLISQKNKDKFLKSCEFFVNNDEAFKNFRQGNNFGGVLEGNDENDWDVSGNYIVQHGGESFLNENLNKFLRNDSIGNPKTYQGISIATMRYINSAYEISLLLKDYRPKRILEIGGGYGGLCRILSEIYNFEEYTDKDLPQVENLFKKYLSKFRELNGRINTTISGTYDLFIADSSLSECDRKTQLFYGNLAIKCKYVYLVYNTVHIIGGRENFRDLFKLFKDYNIIRVPGIETSNDGIKSFTNTFLMEKI